MKYQILLGVLLFLQGLTETSSWIPIRHTPRPPLKIHKNETLYEFMINRYMYIL